ncbi:MAG: hypothetical protein KIT74_01665 [Fimbriimonadales bacterium]|nr:hypothetical protein [Fimbriimonadales bacterium]
MARDIDPRIEKCLRLNEEERLDCLNDVCERTARPVIEAVLKKKFGCYFNRQEESVEEAAYWDAVSDATIAVHRNLLECSNGKREPIADVQSYSASVAEKAFLAYLKRKHPQRYSLATKYRATLDVDPRLAYWKHGNMGTSGNSEWSGQPAIKNRESGLASTDPTAAVSECFGGQDSGSLLLPDLFLATFTWTKGPLEFNVLVKFTMVATNVVIIEVEPEPDYESDEPSGAIGGDPSEAAESKDLLSWIWETLKGLSAQRAGIFLLFEPPGQEQQSLVDLLAMNQIASLEEIASVCGLSWEDYHRLSQRERVTFQDLADQYGISQKQADGIRKGVLELLARRISKRSEDN